MRRNPRFAGLAVLLALVFGGVAVGQVVTMGQITGQVKDETGAALPGATVTAVSAERGGSKTTTTDSSGKFRFSDLQPGRYNVSVTLTGFATVTRTDNLVENQKTTDLPVSMKLSGQSAEVLVTGEVPMVDKTNASLENKQRAKEFEKMPVGRSFQALFLNAPGVNLVPGANPNPIVHGALSSNNLWLYDGADITDPTTGTFGGNLNFEAIQEVSVITSGVSAEYGRAIGGIINVITKSGTNQFAGSGKVIMTNDKWDSQNTTKNGATGVSLARVKYDHVNPRYALTLGGPVWKDHVWFFGAYESADRTTGQQSTPVSGENFQQSTKDRFWDAKLTGQITPSISAMARGVSSPTSGFIVNYAFFGAPGELVAYTGQDQTSQQYLGNLTGVFGSNLTAEVAYNWNGPGSSSSKHGIDVYPFAGAGPMHFDESTGFQYNGPTFNGFVNRPRQGALGALNYYANLGGNSHNFKVGVDYQHLESSSQFGFVGNQVFRDLAFDFRTRNFTPDTRRDYDPPVASTSDGKIYALYAQDKFEVGKHVFLNVGFRYEHQNSSDDISRTTVDKGTISPRLSVSYDIFGSGKSLVVGTYGRFYQFVLQSFSDGFGQNAQQASYNNFVWNAAQSQYLFSNRVVGAGSAATIPSDLKPTYTDEGTLGFRQQIGNSIGVQVTGIYRKWGNIIDDVPILSTSGAQTVAYQNFSGADHKFYGAEIVLDKRFSDHWNANASYAWGKTKLNASATSNVASSLGDFLTSNCRTTLDSSIGNGGIIPCADVVQGPNRYGEIPESINNAFKAFGAYVQPIGRVNLALGLGAQLLNGVHFQKQRSVNVLIPGCVVVPTDPANRCIAGPAETFFYDARGNETLPSIYQIDASLEATFNVFSTIEFGVKGEVFNVTDQQRQVKVDNFNWCGTGDTAPSSCAASRATFGTGTTRASYQVPRNYRLTALVRF